MISGEIIDFINDRLKETKMTQKELSEKSGVPQSTVSRILNKEVSPLLDNLETMIRAVGYQFISIRKPRSKKALSLILWK